VDERVHAGRPEDGAALVEDPPDVVPGEGTDEAFHQPSPPLHDAHAFAAVTYDSGDDATDRGIQARTVTSCSEHPHLHRFPLIPRRRRPTPGLPSGATARGSREREPLLLAPPARRHSPGAIGTAQI